jgi:hypothetical protein
MQRVDPWNSFLVLSNLWGIPTREREKSAGGSKGKLLSKKPMDAPLISDKMEAFTKISRDILILLNIL